MGENESSKQLSDLHGITQLSESKLETWTFTLGSASYTFLPRFSSVSARYHRGLHWNPLLMGLLF